MDSIPKSFSNLYIHQEAAAGSTTPPIRPFSDNYAEELELDEDHERIKWSYGYPPARTSVDHEAAAGSTGPPITPFSDMYAEELEQQLLLFLDKDQEIIEGTPEYPSAMTSAEDREQQQLLLDEDHEIIEGSREYPLLTISAGELVASAHNYNVVAHIQVLLQLFWSTPRVIEVLETDKFIPCSSRRCKSESPSKLSPKRKRRSWESKHVNNGGSTAENMIDCQLPLIRVHHDEDMLWMESFNSIIAAERLGSSAAYSSRNTNPNNDDSDEYYDYYMSCSNVNNNNIAAFTW